MDSFTTEPPFGEEKNNLIPSSYTQDEQIYKKMSSLRTEVNELLFTQKKKKDTRV